MALINTNPNPPQRYSPRGKKREYQRHFIFISEPKKFRYCWICRKTISKNENFITGIGDIFHGRVVMGVLCKDCLFERVHQLDSKVLKKGVVKSIIARQVARKV